MRESGLYVIFVSRHPGNRLELAARPGGGYCILRDGQPLPAYDWPEDDLAQALATFRALSTTPQPAATAA